MPDAALKVGGRVYLAIAGHAINSKVFLPKGARGVVTEVDPTDDIITVNFEFHYQPGGLRVPVSHVGKINHDPKTTVHD